MKADRKIVVQAASSRYDLDRRGADVEEHHFTSIKEACARAKYLLTSEYARRSEMVSPFGFARVLVNGECENEFVGPNP